VSTSVASTPLLDHQAVHRSCVHDAGAEIWRERVFYYINCRDGHLALMSWKKSSSTELARPSIATGDVSRGQPEEAWRGDIPAPAQLPPDEQLSPAWEAASVPVHGGKDADQT
jgi:hypothetical protein